MIKRIVVSCILFFIMAINFLFASEAQRMPTRRFGIFIGANNGGNDRVRLRYAVSDARSMARIFLSMGGISSEDCIVLAEPSIREINRHLDNIGRLSAQLNQRGQRTELIFYYSGHSDEDGIFLNRERLSYRDLRTRIDNLRSDMKIIILDSCSSGAMTRAKGGTMVAPFLFDSSISTEGYAILTSSSFDEVSQESDTIQSSYFTYSLLAGLRGAADSVGDRRVTLNELYRYAYTETLARTETSLFGTQHPSFDIQMSGSGEVILTDISEITSSVILGDDITGRITIRDSSDFLILELSKVTARPIELGLEPGQYRIILQRGNNFFRADITLAENRSATLRMSNLRSIAAESGNRTRGDNFETEEDANIIPFNLQFIPGFNMFGGNYANSTTKTLLTPFVGIVNNLNGFGAAGFGIVGAGNVKGFTASGFFNVTIGDADGFQGAGFFNSTGGSAKGFQGAGFFNIAGVNENDEKNNLFQSAGFFNVSRGRTEGFQGAGFFNYAKELHGLQMAGVININENGSGGMVGVINISNSPDVTPIGLINIIKGGIFHPAVYVDDLFFTNLSLRSGSKHFYGLISVGANIEGVTGNNTENYLIHRAGFGFEIPISALFINIDLSFGTLLNLNTLNNSTQIYQLRLTTGLKFLPHLGIFAGVSYEFFYRQRGGSPDPRDTGSMDYGLWFDEVEDRHAHKIGFFAGIEF